jgi:MoxR-like ATPase
MPNDDALQVLFSNIADSSGGRIGFRTVTVGALSREFGLKLSRSSNSVYIFTVTSSTGEQLTSVAFTLSLDGAGRPATRAEALGKSLADSNGDLFRLNPFLLVYDYSGDRLLAVSAIDLFGEFAEHAAQHNIPYAANAFFSLTPNFERGTIYMYANLRPPAVWETSTAPRALSGDDLVAFLQRVGKGTAAKAASVAAIVGAIRTRLAAAPASSSPGASSDPVIDAGAGSAEVEYALLDPADDAVQVEDRIWRIIMTAIASSAAVILVGPPGTGKSALIRKAVGTISTRQQANGQPGVKIPIWATPDESWTSRELIGGETVAGADIVFRPGWVLRAIEEDRWLVLDEANRGDLDRIFGALLTWLAGGEVTVGVESSAVDAKLIKLGWTSGKSYVDIISGTGRDRGEIKYLAGNDWRLLGTYNALDSQRVFRIGAALGRRFARAPVPPIPPELFTEVLERRAVGVDSNLRAKIVSLYTAHYEEEVTRIGPALFLGMCSYLRSAVAAEKSEAGSADQSSTDEGTQATVDSDSILAEAYVLSLGTFLAQLEQPDFEQLELRIRRSSAMPEEEIEWVRVTIRALA